MGIAHPGVLQARRSRRVRRQVGRIVGIDADGPAAGDVRPATHERRVARSLLQLAAVPPESGTRCPRRDRLRGRRRRAAADRRLDPRPPCHDAVDPGTCSVDASGRGSGVVDGKRVVFAPEAGDRARAAAPSSIRVRQGRSRRDQGHAAS